MVLLSQKCCLRNVSRQNEKFACRADSAVYSALHHAIPLLAKANFTRPQYRSLVFHFEVLCSLNSYLIFVFSCKDLWRYFYTLERFGWKSQARSTESELHLSSNMQIYKYTEVWQISGMLLLHFWMKINAPLRAFHWELIGFWLLCVFTIPWKGSCSE